MTGESDFGNNGLGRARSYEKGFYPHFFTSDKSKGFKEWRDKYSELGNFSAVLRTSGPFAFEAGYDIDSNVDDPTSALKSLKGLLDQLDFQIIADSEDSWDEDNRSFYRLKFR